MIDELTQIQTLFAQRSTISHLSWSPDGRMVAARVYDGTIRVWDMQTSDLVADFQQKPISVSQLVWSPLGNTLASCRNTYGLRIWDVRDGSCCYLQGDISSIETMAWSPDGTTLAVAGSKDNRIQFWNVRAKKIIKTITVPGVVHDLTWFYQDNALAVVTTSAIYIHYESGERLQRVFPRNFDASRLKWSPDGKILASNVAFGIRLWDFQAEREIGVLEATAETITCLTFSGDGALLAYICINGTVELWACNGWRKLYTLQAEQSQYDTRGTIAFSPISPCLALPSDMGKAISIWTFDVETLLRRAAQISTSLYTTVKVALVGRSAVGKTVLGWRLVHGTFKEHPSSHGQHFWLFESLSYVRHDGIHCDVILWDLAGQPDYRITHVLFLNDVDLALVLFDSTDQMDPLKDVEYWLKQLPNTSRKILVGSKSDRGFSSLATEELAEFCNYHQITGGVVITSAFTGEGVSNLGERIKNVLDSVELTATLATSIFYRIKTYLLGLKEEVHHQSNRESGGPAVLVDFTELVQQLQLAVGSFQHSENELHAAVRHLERHGFVKRITTSTGGDVILLIPELLNNLAASLVLEARRNDRGLGAIDEDAVLRGELPFPELDNLNETERAILLDATVSLLIERNVCFRATIGNTILLVFPALINQKRPLISTQGTIEGTTFIVTGSIENVYAGLVVLLGYTNTFTRTNQWQNQAQYEIEHGMVCGFRLVDEHEDEIQLVLYFGRRVPQYERLLFEGLFEQFLRKPELAIQKYPPVKCDKCEKFLPRPLLVEYLSKKKESVYCPKCGNNVFIGSKTKSRSKDVRLDQKVQLQTMKESEQTRAKTVFEAALVRLKRFRTLQVPRERNPTCFLSYAWGERKIEQWVKRLAQDLRDVEIDVLLDKWHSAEAGLHIGRYIEKIETSDFTVVIGTPEYKKKRTEQGVLSAEIDALETLIIESHSKPRIIPLLRRGEKGESFPVFFRGLVYIDFRDEEHYYARLFDLVLNLYDISVADPQFADCRDMLSNKSSEARAS